MSDNKYEILQTDVFDLLCCIAQTLTAKICDNQVDSQGVFAYVKLVDSFIKISEAQKLNNDINKISSSEQIIDEDKSTITRFMIEHKINV